MAHQRLTTFPHDPLLDLEPWVGQRQATFRFELLNGVTGERLGQITPLRPASLTHDTQRTIKRQLNLNLGVADTAQVNPVTDRIDLFMVFPTGAEYPMGRYMFTDASRRVFTSGIPGPHTAGGLADMSLNDEMFMVDQQIIRGVNGANRTTPSIMEELLKDFTVELNIDPSPYTSQEAWSPGTNRGSILEALAVSGDYFSPWFGNDHKYHCIRSFDPATRLPDFDYDTHQVVFRETIIETDDLLTAPNEFVVVSNGAADPTSAVVGRAEVPPSAPHSRAQRGFTIPLVVDLQIDTQEQVGSVARGLMQRFTVFERVSLSTPPDPRHDSYNVIRWQGETWLELSWSMNLSAGGAMSHLLRKTYR